jgi:hypothetical protein
MLTKLKIKNDFGFDGLRSNPKIRTTPPAIASTPPLRGFLYTRKPWDCRVAAKGSSSQ